MGGGGGSFILYNKQLFTIIDLQFSANSFTALNYTQLYTVS